MERGAKGWTKVPKTTELACADVFKAARSLAFKELFKRLLCLVGGGWSAEQ